MFVHIIVHNCHIQHSREQFWLSSLLSSRQAPEIRCRRGLSALPCLRRLTALCCYNRSDS